MAHELQTSPASAPSKPLTRRELREAERLAALQAQAPAAPLAFASRRERRAAERATEATVATEAPSTAAPLAATTGPVVRRVTRRVADVTVTAPILRPVSPVAPTAHAVAAQAPELPAVVIPAAVAARPALTPVAQLATESFGLDEEGLDASIVEAIAAGADLEGLEPGDASDLDEIELPLSFRRNLAALQPVPALRRGSKRALVRVKRGVAGTTKRGAVARGVAGATALGFAATVAVATTLPAAAENTGEQQAADAIVGEAGGAQTFTVGNTTAMDVTTASGVAGDRAPAYAVATMGSATAYNTTFGIQRPDPKAYQNNLTAPVQWPFPTGVVISDYFGSRVAPCSGCSSDHKGVDFTPGDGTPIGSIAAGRVITANQVDNGGLGVYVEVEHVINGQRVVSVYGHLLTGSIPVKVGDVVKVGDEIGKVGNTGSSTGAHLHLEVHVGTEKIDPFAFLVANNVPQTVVDRPADASVQA